ILSRNEDRGVLVDRLVQHEVRIGLALREIHARLADIEITPRVEQVRTEPRALDRLQELFRDDRVRVDVLAIERRADAGVDCELLHGETGSTRVNVNYSGGDAL